LAAPLAAGSYGIILANARSNAGTNYLCGSDPITGGSTITLQVTGANFATTPAYVHFAVLGSQN
jgi:hypothetical protein